MTFAVQPTCLQYQHIQCTKGDTIIIIIATVDVFDHVNIMQCDQPDQYHDVCSAAYLPAMPTPTKLDND